MKKICLTLCALLCAALLLSCSAGTLPTATDAPAQTDAVLPAATDAPAQTDAAQPGEPVDGLFEKLDASAPFVIDWNCDGTETTVSVTVDLDKYTTTVTAEHGGKTETDTLDFALDFLSCYLGDVLTGDGCRELFLTGDTGSCDYETVIYRLTETGLQKTIQSSGEVLRVYGNGAVEFSEVVDVLGTYGATCSYRMDDAMALTRMTDYTVFQPDDVWTAGYPLTLQKDGLTALCTSGGESELRTLDAGTKLILTATDEATYAVLETESGDVYRVGLSQNTAAGWGWLVEGVPEGDWFGELRYAG